MRKFSTSEALAIREAAMDEAHRMVAEQGPEAHKLANMLNEHFNDLQETVRANNGDMVLALANFCGAVLGVNAQVMKGCPSDPDASLQRATLLNVFAFLAQVSYTRTLNEAHGKPAVDKAKLN